MLKAWTYVSSRLAALKRDERGVTALEYGVIAAGIILAIVLVVRELGTTLQSTFETIRDNL